MAKLTLTDEQKVALAGMSDAERKAYDAMTDDQKAKHLDNLVKDAYEADQKTKIDYDVENLKEATTLIAKMASGIVAAKEDGQWTFSDALYFGDMLKAIPAAVKDYDKIDDEIKDMNLEEVEEVLIHVAGKLDFIDDIEAYRNWLLKCLKVAIEFVNLVKEGILLISEGAAE